MYSVKPPVYAINSTRPSSIYKLNVPVILHRPYSPSKTAPAPLPRANSASLSRLFRSFSCSAASLASTHGARLAPHSSLFHSRDVADASWRTRRTGTVLYTVCSECDTIQAGEKRTRGAANTQDMPASFFFSYCVYMKGFVSVVYSHCIQGVHKCRSFKLYTTAYRCLRNTGGTNE